MSRNLEDFFRNELFAGMDVLPRIYDDNARIIHYVPENYECNNDNHDDIARKELALPFISFEKSGDDSVSCITHDTHDTASTASCSSSSSSRWDSIPVTRKTQQGAPKSPKRSYDDHNPKKKIKGRVKGADDSYSKLAMDMAMLVPPERHSKRVSPTSSRTKSKAGVADLLSAAIEELAFDDDYNDEILFRNRRRRHVKR